MKMKGILLAVMCLSLAACSIQTGSARLGPLYHDDEGTAYRQAYYEIDVNRMVICNGACLANANKEVDIVKPMGEDESSLAERAAQK